MIIAGFFFKYIFVWVLYLWILNSSILNTSVLGPSVWEHDTRIRSLLQLPNNEISSWWGILWLSQLVRRPSMVSVGTYHRWHYLSRTHDNKCNDLSLPTSIEFNCRCSKCLRVFGTAIFIIYHHCNLLTNKWTSLKGKLL